SDRNGSLQLFRQTLGKDNAEIIETSTSSLRNAVLSPDGTGILFDAQPNPATKEVRRVPVNGGPSQVIASTQLGNPFSNLIRCSRAPATLCVMAEAPADRTEIVFVQLDPVKGRGGELQRFKTDPSGFYEWTLSPDGTRIAMLNPPEGKIHILHLDGKPSEQIV